MVICFHAEASIKKEDYEVGWPMYLYRLKISIQKTKRATESARHVPLLCWQGEHMERHNKSVIPLV